ncbi:MlaD family protein [Flavisolibacter tropicus]|uniref:ABC transporter permease n=1 Tax=Flavisolibacter tropicus TaxID=1492898 RepID=A0A172TYH4_9BACT|nr:MlaD family protein [Flavisolibacter tropicus]ANE51833.1 ABC transporter permease [Flavisolibacter tropicus]
MNKRAITVGIFIFIALVIFIAGVLALGGQNKTFADTISVRAIFNDVNGLQTGNNIWLSGVKVGTVKKLNFISNAQVEVTLNVEEKYQQYVHKDSKAKVGSDGLIGNKIIVIYGGSPQSPVAQTGDILGVEKALSMDDMMSTLQENNKNILAITTDFKEVSKGIAAGQGTLGKLLKDEGIANQVESMLISLRGTSSKADAMVADMADYASKLQAKGSLTNDLITDTVIFSRLRSTMAQVQQASLTANAMIEELHKTTQRLNTNQGAVGVLLNDAEAAAQLKETLRNLQSSTEKLDENMEAMQHNFLFRGYFKKKDKEAAKASKAAASAPQ